MNLSSCTMIPLEDAFRGTGLNAKKNTFLLGETVKRKTPSFDILGDILIQNFVWYIDPFLPLEKLDCKMWNKTRTNQSHISYYLISADSQELAHQSRPPDWNYRWKKSQGTLHFFLFQNVSMILCLEWICQAIGNKVLL